jgi:hypothetical protein
MVSLTRNGIRSLRKVVIDGFYLETGMGLGTLWTRNGLLRRSLQPTNFVPLTGLALTIELLDL